MLRFYIVKICLSNKVNVIIFSEICGFMKKPDPGFWVLYIGKNGFLYLKNGPESCSRSLNLRLYLTKVEHIYYLFIYFGSKI